MNNPLALSNELNSFRGAIQEQIAFHDNMVDNLNKNVLAKRTEAIAQAGKIAAKGAELVRTGLEAEGAIAGGKAIGAAGKAIYNKFYKGRSVANREQTQNTESQEQATQGAEDTGGDTGEVSSSSARSGEIEMTDIGEANNAEGEGLGRVIQGDNVARPTNVTGEPTSTEGAGDIELSERGMRPGQDRPTTETTEGTEAGETAGETAEETTGDLGDALGDATQAAEGAVSDAVESGASALSGAGDALAGAATGIGDAADAAITGGAEAAESALAEAAAATSWIPFVGEVLGGIAAVGGLVTAGVGVYDDIVGGDAEKKAEQMATKAAPQPGVNVAGGYIAPLASSVSV